MKKLLVVSIAMLAFCACSTKNGESGQQKQSEDELKSAITGSWYATTGEEKAMTPTTPAPDSLVATSDIILRRSFSEDGKYFESEIARFMLKDDIHEEPLYALEGAWDIKGDSLVLIVDVANATNPERANIKAKEGTVISKSIIKKITADSLIIENGAFDRESNVIDFVFIRE